MPKAICADKPGGTEVLDWREIETPKLGPHDVLIHQHHRLQRYCHYLEVDLI